MHATWNCLKTANEKGYKSIGMPSISKGVYSFSPKICADYMIPTVVKYMKEQNKNLKKIALVLEDQEDYDAFCQRIKELTC